MRWKWAFKFWFNINISKTKFMTTLVANENLSVNNLDIQQVYSYKYIGHEIRFRRYNQTYEIDERRICLIWAAFRNLNYFLKSDIPMFLKGKSIINLFYSSFIFLMAHYKSHSPSAIKWRMVNTFIVVIEMTFIMRHQAY